VLEQLEGAEAATGGGGGTAAGDGAAGGDAAGGGVVGGVLCAGLSCVDMQLLQASRPSSDEAIARFAGHATAPGGSASNTASALRTLRVGAAVITCVGEDANGAELERAYAREGIDTRLLMRRSGVSTSLAVLPVFEDGGRGCWVDLSANDLLTPVAVLETLRSRVAQPTLSTVRALHVGYPHLLRELRGSGLASVLAEGGALLAAAAGAPPLVSVDVNGATLGAEADDDGVLGPSLPLIDLLHANLEEACHLAGVHPPLAEADASEAELRGVAQWFTSRGVAVVAITLGAAGAYVHVTPDAARMARLPTAASAWQLAEELLLPSAPTSGAVNANGAGDAFVAGLIAALLWPEPLALHDALRLALGSARQRIDVQVEPRGVAELLREIRAGSETVLASGSAPGPES